MDELIRKKQRDGVRKHKSGESEKQSGLYKYDTEPYTRCVRRLSSLYCIYSILDSWVYEVCLYM